MAFMQTQSANSGDAGERLPILKYDSRAGRLFVINRMQDSAGNWVSEQEDITMQSPTFAVDFGTLDCGWSFFAAGAAPMWAVAPYGQQMPARPASPGNDDKGKAMLFKSAFRIKVMGKSIGGVREFGGNAMALIGGLNDLHTEFEAAPEAATGMIPVVKMVNTIPIKSGQSTNYQPVFAIQQWVARPNALGSRTVLPPIGGARTSAPPPPPAGNHVPPPPPKAAPVADVIDETEMPF